MEIRIIVKSFESCPANDCTGFLQSDLDREGLVTEMTFPFNHEANEHAFVRYLVLPWHGPARDDKNQDAAGYNLRQGESCGSRRRLDHDVIMLPADHLAPWQVRQVRRPSRRKQSELAG